jgi:hypothetical protein
VGGGHQSGAAIDWLAGIPSASAFDHHYVVGGVQPDSSSQRTGCRPRLVRERALNGGCCDGRIACGREGRRHPVAHPGEDETMVGCDHAFDEFVVSDHCGLHRLVVLFPHARGTFEIGEQECHRARRRMHVHASPPTICGRRNCQISFAATPVPTFVQIAEFPRRSATPKLSGTRRLKPRPSPKAMTLGVLRGVPQA